MFKIGMKISLGVLLAYSVSLKAQQNQTTVTTEESTTKAKVEEPKLNWTSTYAAEIFGPSVKGAKGTQIEHHMGLHYKLLDGWTLGGVLRPNTQLGQTNAAQTSNLGDSYLRMAYPVYKNESGTDISGQLRYYLPVGKASIAKQKIAQVQPRIYMTQAFGSTFELNYILVPMIHLNKTTDDETVKWGHAHYLEPSYKFSDFFSVQLGLEYVYEDVEVAHRADNREDAMYPGFTLQFTKDMSLFNSIKAPISHPSIANSAYYGAFSYKLF